MSREVEATLSEIYDKSHDTSNRLGLWPGRVEDTDDPQRLGRIRVRVFHLHGDGRSTPTLALPWCEVMDFGGGGYDYGSGGRQYIVGSTVWVSFEMGDERHPVVVGGRRGSAVRDDKNPVEYLTVSGQSSSGIEQSWLPEEGNEIPKDVFIDSADGDNHPTRTVWNKSYKGHTILCEDRDGFEFLKIIDRAGQVIEMNCPVTETDNANNSQQRGSRNASNDTQLPQSVLVNQKAFIRIKDVGGQEILLDGTGGGERIVIQSKNKQGSAKQTITLNSGKGSERIEIVDKQGNVISMDPNNAKESITIQDYTGNKMTFNGDDGALELVSNASESHTTGEYTANIGQNKVQTISGNDEKTVLGNKILSILNDLSASINGMTSAVFSGAVQATIANSPANGVPENTSLSIELATGGFHINSQINADPMRISTLAGDLQFDTLAGNITIQTTAGNIVAKTTAGSAEYGADAGSTTIQGSAGISLGGVPAIYPSGRGDMTSNALTIVGTLAASDVRVCMGIPIPPTSLAGLPAALTTFTTPGGPLSISSLLNKTQ